MSTITIDNSPHFKAWVEELRTTTAPQVQGVLLSGDTPEDAGLCCLAVGAKCAGLEIRMDEDSYGFTFTTEHDEPRVTDTMPPLAFHEWLGITVSDDEARHGVADVFIDWPDGDRFVGRNEEEVGNFEEPYMLDEETATASALNDKLGLTFAQIADVLAYFGVKGEQ